MARPQERERSVPETIFFSIAGCLRPFLEPPGELSPFVFAGHSAMRYLLPTANPRADQAGNGRHITFEGDIIRTPGPAHPCLEASQPGKPGALRRAGKTDRGGAKSCGESVKRCAGRGWAANAA